MGEKDKAYFGFLTNMQCHIAVAEPAISADIPAKPFRRLKAPPLLNGIKFHLCETESVIAVMKEIQLDHIFLIWNAVSGLFNADPVCFFLQMLIRFPCATHSG